MAKNWIVMNSYQDLLLAEMDKNLLEKANIPCYLEGAGMAQANPLYNQATQGIRLRVPEERVEEARRTLNSSSLTSNS